MKHQDPTLTDELMFHIDHPTAIRRPKKALTNKVTLLKKKHQNKVNIKTRQTSNTSEDTSYPPPPTTGGQLVPHHHNQQHQKEEG